MRLKKVVWQLDKRIAWLSFKLMDFEDTECHAYHMMMAERSAMEVARDLVKKEDEMRAIERMEQ